MNTSNARTRAKKGNDYLKVDDFSSWDLTSKPGTTAGAGSSVGGHAHLGLRHARLPDRPRNDGTSVLPWGIESVDRSWVPPNEDLTVEAVAAALLEHAYLADKGLATSIFLSMVMNKPLLLEGEAGVGKTEVAKVMAAWTGGTLLRLQCYEGIDAAQAIYEWDYARQLLHLRTVEASGATAVNEDELYSERFLVRRPLLAAIDHGAGPPPVLLIDEIDRADDEFEAMLLEVLSDYTISVPELGTFRAKVPPRVVLTSNRTRDVHDALKRRCLYHWIDHPDFEREVAIVGLRLPSANAALVRQVAAAVEALRKLHLFKPPGVAETIDWVTALTALDANEIDEQRVALSLGTVLKYQEDQATAQSAGLSELVRTAHQRGH